MRRFFIFGLTSIVFVFLNVVWATPERLVSNSVWIETEEVVEPIPYEVHYRLNRDMGRGRVKKVVNGEEGLTGRVIHKLVIDGQVVDTREDDFHKPPVAAVFDMGPSGFKTSRGSFTRSYVTTMESTAYTPDAGRGRFATFRTATGRKAEYGLVAVDPRVIPLGTMMFVEGYGLALAADTGGAIKGNIIDVCVPDRATAMKWGRRMVKVHIFHQRAR